MYNFLCCSDNQLFNQIIVLMKSAFCNCKEKCVFYIMQSDFSDMQKNLLKKFEEENKPNEIKLLEVKSSQYDIFQRSKRWPVQSHYYFLCHLYLPEDVDRVLYLDPDTMIRRDISGLYNTPFDNNFFVVSSLRKDMSHKEYSYIVEKKYKNVSAFNSGVVLINIRKFREEGIDVEFYRKQIDQLEGEEYFFDQGLLNYIFWDKCKYVSGYKYNYISSEAKSYAEIFEKSLEERRTLYNRSYHDDYCGSEAATIVHFCGLKTCKPWKVFVDTNLRMNYVEVKWPSVDTEIIPYVKNYYTEWWEYAKNVPTPIYEELLCEAKMLFYGDENEELKKTKKTLSNYKLLEKNMENILVDLAIKGNFYQFINKICKDNKKVAVLMCKNRTGELIMGLFRVWKVNVIYTNNYRPEQIFGGGDDWKLVKSADYVLHFNIYNNVSHDIDNIHIYSLAELTQTGIYQQ